MSKCIYAMKTKSLFPSVLLTILMHIGVSTDGTGQIQIETHNVSCKGGSDGSVSITVPNATEEVHYLWADDNSNQRTRTGLKAGKYTVTIVDATGCDHINMVEIFEPETELVLKIKRQPVDGPHKCWRETPILLTATASGGTPPYLINGVPGNKFELKVNTTGLYGFSVVDDAGCIKSNGRKVIIGYKWCSQDPNDIVGPSGFDQRAWVSKDDTLPYTIHFENDPLLATAPAQFVYITYEFDTEINPYTFRLGSFGFGDYTFTVPENTSSFQQRYDITATHDVFLDVVAGFDVQNNRAFWSLLAVDPLTGLRPINPLVGFLPVNDTLVSSGEGFVSFLVRPKSTVITGDTAHAQAKIIFDENDPINTNIWTNAIDALPPVTILDALEPITEENEIPLSWNGNDDTGGCGISHYELYSSRDNAAFQLLHMVSAEVTSYVFTGAYGSHYAFYVVGVDNVGNREVKTLAETEVFILPSWKVFLDVPLQDVYCIHDTVRIHFSTIMADEIDILMTSDNGTSYHPIAIAIDSVENIYQWILPDSLADNTIQIMVVASDSASIRDSSNNVWIKGTPIIDAGEDVNVCPQQLVVLVPSGANEYFWFPRLGLNPQGNANQSFRPDSSSLYHVLGTDAFGCIGMDSVLITVYPAHLDSLQHFMCDGDSVFVGGDYQTEAGFYTDELISSNGCDSTVVTEIILTGPCAFPSPRIYVDHDAAGLNNGTSWVDAFHDLQDALEAVAYYPNVDTIWIAEGTYYPTDSSDRSIAFALTDSVKIYGGFLGVELDLEERTADASLVQISGDIGVVSDSTDNAYHVFTVDSLCADCVLDGLTIQFGQADFPFNQGAIGAGLLNEGTLLLDNCVVERNTSTLEGAAIYNSGMHADLTLRNCLFRLNASSLERDILNGSGAFIRFVGLNQIEE
jgi:hypothetical protein